jgi:hypothetical protein
MSKNFTNWTLSGVSGKGEASRPWGLLGHKEGAMWRGLQLLDTHSDNLTGIPGWAQRCKDSADGAWLLLNPQVKARAVEPQGTGEELRCRMTSLLGLFRQCSVWESLLRQSKSGRQQRGTASRNPGAMPCSCGIHCFSSVWPVLRVNDSFGYTKHSSHILM